MFPFLRAKPVHCIGLEINADEIRFLHLSCAAGICTVLNHVIVPLPKQTIVAGKVKRFDLLQTVLRKVVQDTATAGLPAAIALPTSRVMTKRIVLSACLSRRECEIEIQTHLSRYLPGMTEELYWDFNLLPPTNDESHDILLVAARAEEVQMYITLLSEAHLRLTLVDVDSHALLRGALLSLDANLLQSSAVVGVWDVGSSVTRFMIFQQAQILLLEQWETVSIHDSLVEIRRALQRFASMHRQLAIEALVLSSDMMDALTHLHEDLEMPLKLANPFQGMQQNVRLLPESLPNKASHFQVCSGLAIRCLAHDGY